MRNVLSGLRNRYIFIVLSVFVSISFMFFVNNQAFAAGSNIMYSKKDCENLGTTWKKGTLEYGCSIFLYEDGRDLIQWVSGVELGEKYIPTGSKILVYNFYSTNNNNKMPSKCADGFRQGEFKGWNGCIRDSNKSATGLPKESLGKDWTENKCKDSGGVWHNRAGDVLGCVFSTGGERVTLQKSLFMYLGASGYYYSSNNTRIPEKFYPDGAKCPSGYSKKEEKKDGKTSTVCVKNGSEDPNANNDDDGDGIKNSDDEDYIPSTQSGNSKTSCAIDSVGWIICPTTNFMASVVKNAYKWIAEEFLTIKSNLLFQSDSNTFKYWANFRDVANILFVILFVVIIFSQITNIGLSNYGLKKMLPRLLVFVVLINVSYWVSVIFVDASNILGREIFNVLSSEEMKGITSLESDVTSVLAAASGAALAYSGGIFLSLIAAIVAILVVLATLVIRQAAVVILIVISPIAFASAILPGTESLFSRWKSILKAMLIVYPVSSLLVGGMLTASNILVGTTERIGGVNGFGLRVIYTLLPIAGLVSIFAVIKGALAAIDKLTGGSITGKLSSMASGLNKAAEKSPIGSLDKGINSRIAAKYQQFGGGKIFRRANRFAKAGEESRARALRDAQISDYENKATLNDGEQLHLSKLRADKQKEADLLTSSRARALSESIGSDSAAYLNQGLAAIGKQDGGQEFGVVLESLMSNQRISGKVKVEQMTNIIKSLTPEQAQSESVRKVMSAFVSKHGGELKKNDPALLKAIGDLADGSEQSGKSIYEGHAASADTYADASLAERAAWAPQTLQNIANNKSSWTPSQQHDAALKSAAILNDERILKDMSTSQGDLHRKIAGDTEFKVNHSASGSNSNSDPGPTKEQLIEQRRQESERWRRRGRGL